MKRDSLNYKVLLLFTLFVISHKLVKAQTPLNVVSDLNYHQQIPYAIYQTNDGRIFTAGLALPKAEPFNREALFVEYNDNLFPIAHTVLHEEANFQTLSNQAKELVFREGKLYKAFHEDSFDPNGHQNSYGFIGEYNIATGSIKYLYQVKDTVNDFGFVAPVSILLSEDSKLVVLNISGASDIWIQVADLDANGNGIKNFRFSDAEYKYFPKEILRYQSGYILFSEVSSVTNHLGLLIWKLDKDFNIIESKLIDNTNYRNIYIEGVLDSEQNIVIAYNEHEGDLRSFRPLAIKMDTSLNILWQKPIGDPVFFKHNVFYNELVQSHLNDSYLFCGLDGGRDSISESRGQIAKLSLDGDSIWHRKYSALSDQHKAKTTLNSIARSIDGNYFVCGETSNSNAEQDSIIVKTWMLKIDENGHLVMKDTTNNTILLKNDNIRIFPNPTSSILFIEHDRVENITYELYDTQGNMVFSSGTTTAYSTYILDLSAYPSGLYYLHIIDANSNRKVKRIVVD